MVWICKYRYRCGFPWLITWSEFIYRYRCRCTWLGTAPHNADSLFHSSSSSPHIYSYVPTCILKWHPLRLHAGNLTQNLVALCAICAWKLVQMYALHWHCSSNESLQGSVWRDHEGRCWVKIATVQCRDVRVGRKVEWWTLASTVIVGHCWKLGSYIFILQTTWIL